MFKRKISKFFKVYLVLTILIILIVLWSLGPIAWSFIISITPEKNLISKPPVINIESFKFSNYRLLITGKLADKYEPGKYDLTGTKAKREIQDFRDSLKNSIIVALISTVLTVSISVVAGYAFTRFRYFGKRFLFLAIILTMPIPIVVLAIPLIRIMSSFNLIDTYLGLSLLYTSFVMPLTIWMASSYLQTIPRDLEDASFIDGCSRTSSFFRILIPLAKPVIGSIAIIAFLNSWGQFFLPLIFAPSNSKQLSVVLANFVGKYIIQRSQMAAGGIIAIIPPIILVLFFSRFIISGLTKGAVKQ